jgi:subtilisin family serine protease
VIAQPSSPGRRTVALACTLGLLTGTLTLPTPARADDTRDRQWYLSALQIPAAQEITTGSGVVVAVVDTGVNSGQAELVGSVLPGADAYASFGPGDVSDTNGHGTAMATLIAGHGYGAGATNGILGIAPGAQILPVKSFDVLYPNAGVANGVGWAADQGAKVICVASGGSDTPEWATAMAKVKAADALVITGTGNRDAERTHIGYPAKLDGVLAVGATIRNRELAGYSLTGPETALTAPGTAIPSPKLGGGYESSDGTSNSTAIVAGVAALVRAKYPNLSAAEVAHRLEATADDQGPPGRDDQYGYGIVNPVKALTADVPPLGSSSPPRSPGGHAQAPGSQGHWTLVIGGAVIAVSLAIGALVIVLAVRRYGAASR